MEKKNKKTKKKPFDYPLLPGELPDIRDELRVLFEDNLEAWLDQPHIWFHLRKPRELIGTDEEWKLRNWFRMVKNGMVT